MKLFKRLIWFAALAGSGYYLSRSYKKYLNEENEAERREEDAKKKALKKLAENGLTETDLNQICSNNKSGTVKLAELLKKSTSWDLGDTWKGTEDYISDNMILVSQVNNPSRGNKLDWTVKIKMPAFKPNTPIAPDYVDQLEQFLSDYLGAMGVEYRTKKKYFGIYNLSGNYVTEESGVKRSPLFCFPIISDDLDAFRESDGKGNGLEKMFELFKAECYEELEQRLGMREEMFLQDLELYVEVTIPVLMEEGIRGLDLLGMHDFLKELLGLQITNSRSGGRFAQTLGPVALCSDIESLNREVTSFLIWNEGELQVKDLEVTGSDDEDVEI
jgi:hypothetical protein